MKKESHVPFMILLHEGVVSCPQCFVELDDVKPFTVEDCPGCGMPLYMPLIIKDYVLYKPLGQGGEGQVYKAFKKGKKERFAIKFFHRLQNENEKDNPFIQEGTSGAIVAHHPNLVPIIDYGYENDEFFIIFPLIEGERVDEYIQRKRHISETRAFNIMIQIIAAEEYICSKDYLYRDLKPENILLEKNGNVKIFDYGLCIPIEDAKSNPDKLEDIQGSPFYIPPERILGEAEGEFSEIYSLGMLLYYMLKGKTYFSETEINKLIEKHADEVNYESVRLRLKNCHPGTIHMIDKMIKKSPDERYQNFQALKTDITAIQKELLEKPVVLLKKKKS